MRAEGALRFSELRVAVYKRARAESPRGRHLSLPESLVKVILDDFDSLADRAALVRMVGARTHVLPYVDDAWATIQELAVQFEAMRVAKAEERKVKSAGATRVAPTRAARLERADTRYVSAGGAGCLLM